MNWRIVLAVLLGDAWYGSRPSLRAQVNACMMEAERTYPDHMEENRGYLSRLSYAAECMQTHEYVVRYDLPGCEGNEIPPPQSNEECYRVDWRAWFGLPRSN